MEKRSPLAVVDVVVPTRDRPRYLAEALTSIQAVADRLKGIACIRPIVVDDSRGDEAAAVAEAQGAHYVRSTGTGPSAARNTGIRATSGEFIAFLDDDDTWLLEQLSPQLAILAQRPEVAMVYAQGILADSELRPAFPPAPSGPLPSGDVFSYFLKQCVSCNTMVIRRRTLEQVGLFDEGLFSSEDWDLILRIASRFDCVGLEMPVSLFRQSAANAKDGRMWQEQFVTALRVLRRGSRLSARSSVSRRKKLLLTLAIRGWFAYRMTESAQTFLRRGDRREALRCLGVAFTTSPLHATLRISGFWSTLVRCLALSARAAATA